MSNLKMEWIAITDCPKVFRLNGVRSNEKVYLDFKGTVPGYRRKGIGFYLL